MTKKLYVFHFEGNKPRNFFKNKDINENKNYMWIIEQKSFLGWIMVKIIIFKSWRGDFK